MNTYLDRALHHTLTACLALVPLSVRFRSETSGQSISSHRVMRSIPFGFRWVRSFCSPVQREMSGAERLSRAGVTVEFHIRPGVPHEFETYAHASDVARRSVADRLRTLQGI